MRQAAVTGFMGLLFAARSSLAADVILDYSAPEGCPLREQFESEVVTRTSLVRIVQSTGTGRFFKVELVNNGTSTVGRVTSGRESGSAREVTASSCNEVASALALIVALAVDPKALTARVLPSTARFASEDSEREKQPTANPEPAPVEEPPPGPVPYAITPSTMPAREGFRLTQPAVHAVALSIGVRLSGAFWTSSPTVPWASVGTTFVAENPKAVVRAASIIASFAFAKSALVPTSESASARFDSWLVAVGYCPWRFELTQGVLLRPCGGLEGGWLTGTGIAAGRVNQAWSSTRGWAALSELAHLQIRLGGNWQSVLEAGVTEPLWRDTFVFETLSRPVTIVKVPFVIPHLSLGLMARFW